MIAIIISTAAILISLYVIFRDDNDFKRARLEMGYLRRKINEQKIHYDIQDALFELEKTVKESIDENPYIYTQYSDWIVSLSSKMEELSCEIKSSMDKSKPHDNYRIKLKSMDIASAFIRFYLSVDGLDKPEPMLKDQND